MQSSIVSEAKAIENELIAHRRHLHQNPELGFDLPETTAYVMQQLREYGYEPKAVGKAGISAVVGPDGGKTFLIRGDMDALPMKEETGLPFSSINGKMHACGHDFHTSALLGAAKLLKAHESELKGQVKLMFQPAEEIMDGANDMIAAGILENPHVDAAMAIHVLHDSLGKAGYTRGTGCGSSDVFTIKVKGIGGRGVWTYDNIWRWGTCSTRLNGVPFGFNLGYGFSDRSSATENVIFYDGRAHKLQEVVFMIGQDDKGNFNYMDPWTISSSDGRFEGIFEPILDRKAKIDMKVIASDQHQVFGHLTGTAVLDDGTELKMRDVIAAIEVVHNRY